METIRLGISACLLGQPVRYDGGHTLDRFLRDTLGRFVDLVPVCPEVECGLSTPRAPMRLQGDPRAPRLVVTRSGVDQTGRLRRWARARLRALAPGPLDGFVFKSRSPSCGLQRVEVYDGDGVPRALGRGLFARTLTERFPLLPAAEETQLADPEQRERFIERIFVCRRLRALSAAGRGLGPLVEFHQRHELLVRAHSPRHCRALGQLVAAARTLPPAERLARYRATLLEALTLRATPARQANALRHAMGSFERQLDAGARQELLELIQRYRLGQLPLVVPLSLLAHHARRHGQDQLARQVYLAPHPLELLLRNHA